MSAVSQVYSHVAPNGDVIVSYFPNNGAANTRTYYRHNRATNVLEFSRVEDIHYPVAIAKYDSNHKMHISPKFTGVDDPASVQHLAADGVQLVGPERPLRFASNVHQSVSITLESIVVSRIDLGETVVKPELLSGLRIISTNSSDAAIQHNLRCLPLSEWVADWNHLIGYQGTDQFAVKQQRWVATNVAIGLSNKESDQIFKKALTAIREIFPLGINIHLGEFMKLRNSQVRTQSHYDAHGPLVRMDDDFRMSSSILGYNAFRGDFGYNVGQSIEKVALGVPLCVKNGSHFIESFSPVVVCSQGLPYPDEVISATFGRKMFKNCVKRWEKDEIIPNSRVLYDALIDRNEVWLWHGSLIDTDSYCEVQCPSHVVRVVSDIIDMVYQVDEILALDDLIVVILCCQWFADAINATQRRFYCNPVVSRLMAVNEVCGRPYVDVFEGACPNVLLRMEY